jgi:hypothetical protein
VQEKYGPGGLAGEKDEDSSDLDRLLEDMTTEEILLLATKEMLANQVHVMQSLKVWHEEKAKASASPWINGPHFLAHETLGVRVTETGKLWDALDKIF